MYSKIFYKLSNDKGMALIATLILVAAISTFGIALLTMTSSDIKLSSLQEASKETFYIAEAGLERAIEYLEALGNPNFSSPVNPFSDENGGSPVLGNGTYEVSIQSDPDSSMSYKIRSKGERPLNNDNKVIKKIIESKVTLENFAMFAYFSDSELFPASIDYGYGGDKIWFYGTDTIEGRLHSNDRLHMAGTPSFYGTVTSAYRNPVTGDTSWEAYDSQTEPNFYGNPPYQGGVDPISLPTFRKITDPTDSQSLQRIAAGSQSYIEDTSKGNGTYIPNDGYNVSNGIWVKGDVKELVLGTDGAGNSKIIIDQSSTTYPVTTKITTIYKIEAPITINGITYSSGTTLVDDYKNGSHTYTSYNGHTNGVLFVNGKINGLRATATDGGHKGKITIASNYDITIANNLLLNAQASDSYNNCFDDPDSITDSIGLVSEEDIKIATNAPPDIEIDAILMALGTSFYYEGWKSTQKGTLTTYGSFIQKQRGPVGTFSSYGKVSGYTKDYHFDTRMDISNPNIGQVLPPYFPTTGKYVKVYWKEIE